MKNLIYPLIGLLVLLGIVYVAADKSEPEPIELKVEEQNFNGVADDTMTRLVNVMNNINNYYWKLDLYYEDWDTLPVEVKTNIKQRTVIKIENTISELEDIKSDISNF